MKYQYMYEEDKAWITMWTDFIPLEIEISDVALSEHANLWPH